MKMFNSFKIINSVESRSSVVVSREAVSVFDVLVFVFIILLFPHHHFVVTVSIIRTSVVTRCVTISISLLILEVGIVCIVIEVRSMWMSRITAVFWIIIFSAIWTAFIFATFFFWFSNFITYNFNIGFVYNFIVSYRLFVRNWDRDFSDDRNLFDIWSGNRNSSGDWNSLENWILNMMNIVLLVIFLNDGLSYDFFSWNSYSFSSGHIVNNYWFINCVELNLLIFASINLKIDIFPLNYRLNICLIINFSSRSDDSLKPVIFSVYGSSCHWI